MAPRSLLSSRIVPASRHVQRPTRRLQIHTRLLASAPSKQPEPVVNTSGKEQSWLTQRVKANPALYAVFLGFARALGYGSPKQLANRRALHMYNTLCATRADHEVDFWRKGVYPVSRSVALLMLYGLKSVRFLRPFSLGLPLPICTYGCSPSAYAPCLRPMG